MPRRFQTRVYPEQATSLVACPVCSAPKGEKCISSSNPRLHSQRMEAAEEIVDDETERQLKELADRS